jgi:hypothetical protein
MGTWNAGVMTMDGKVTDLRKPSGDDRQIVLPGSEARQGDVTRRPENDGDDPIAHSQIPFGWGG